jgi:hypothetical protein
MKCGRSDRIIMHCVHFPASSGTAYCFCESSLSFILWLGRSLCFNCPIILVPYDGWEKCSTWCSDSCQWKPKDTGITHPSAMLSAIGPQRNQWLSLSYRTAFPSRRCEVSSKSPNDYSHSLAIRSRIDAWQSSLVKSTQNCLLDGGKHWNQFM